MAAHYPQAQETGRHRAVNPAATDDYRWPSFSRQHLSDLLLSCQGKSQDGSKSLTPTQAPSLNLAGSNSGKIYTLNGSGGKYRPETPSQARADGNPVHSHTESASAPGTGWPVQLGTSSDPLTCVLLTLCSAVSPQGEDTLLGDLSPSLAASGLGTWLHSPGASHRPGSGHGTENTLVRQTLLPLAPREDRGLDKHQKRIRTARRARRQQRTGRKEVHREPGAPGQQVWRGPI